MNTFPICNTFLCTYFGSSQRNALGSGFFLRMAFGGGGRSGNENSSTVVSTGSSVISSGNSHFCSSAPVLDRAGLPFRSMTVFTKRSSASTPRSLNSERTFVDSDVNQRIEIVGMPVLKSRRGPTSSSKTYEDNEYNRRLARQRMEQSFIVVSSNSGGGSSSGSKHHVDKSEETEWLHEANIKCRETPVRTFYIINHVHIRTI